MKRHTCLRAFLVMLGIGIGLVTVPGCGSDASGDPKPSAPAATVPANAAEIKSTATASRPTSSKKIDTASRRNRQKSSN